MKLIPALLVACVLISPCEAAPPKEDAFEAGMRQAFVDYKKGDAEAVTAKLRELLKLMEEKGAAKVGSLLPDTVGAWKGETMKQGDLGVVGGGVSVSRTYVAALESILVNVTKDSPLVATLLPLLANEDLLQLANRKTNRVGGETAIMDGEHKMQIVVDGRILLELKGTDGVGEQQLVAFARALDLRAIAKLK